MTASGRTHGKASTYTNGGCRCEACTVAARIGRASWAHRNPAKVAATNHRLYKRKSEFIARVKRLKGCMDCGGKFPSCVLDFDHRPGTIKVTNISWMRTVGFAKIKEEMRKCDVVCANCHRLRTADRRKRGTDDRPT